MMLIIKSQNVEHLMSFETVFKVRIDYICTANMHIKNIKTQVRHQFEQQLVMNYNYKISMWIEERFVGIFMYDWC